ncbi:PilZ domain-containing protein [Desulfoplanes sp.]
MYQFPEKRKFDRHDRLGVLIVTEQDRASTKVILLNYSKTGLYIKSPKSFAPGQTLHISSATSLKGEVAADCRGKVVWCSPVIGKHPHFRAGIRYVGT